MIKQFIKKNILPQLFKIAPIGLLSKGAQSNLIILYYHMISNKTVPHVKNIYPHKRVSAFKNDIDFLLSNFEPIDLFDLLNAIDNERSFKRRSFLLTFDDGYSEMYDVVRPILLEKGISATFFVNSAFVDNRAMCYQNKASVLIEKLKNTDIYSGKTRKKIDEILLKNNLRSGCNGISEINYQQRHIVDKLSALVGINFEHYLATKKPYLTSDQIEHLIRDGFTIGAHSIDHPLYEKLTLDQQLYQTIESMKFVRNRFLLDYSVFAFPHKDSGVSTRFFDEIHKNGVVDISFGTAGLAQDLVPRNIQRISLENPLMPAQHNVAYSYLKKIFKDMMRKNQLKRLDM